MHGWQSEPTDGSVVEAPSLSLSLFFLSLSLSLSTSLSPCLSVSLSPLSLSLSIIDLSIHPSIHPSIYLSVYLQCSVAQLQLQLQLQLYLWCSAVQWSVVQRIVVQRSCRLVLCGVVVVGCRCSCSAMQSVQCSVEEIPQRPKVVRDRQVLTRFTSKCASRHNSVHFIDISTSKRSLNMWCFFKIIVTSKIASGQWRALFQHLNGQKWSKTLLFFEAFCAFRDDGMHFSIISTAKSAPSVVCFAHFDATTTYTFSTAQLPKVPRA